jgi:hypothetical protein
MGPRIPQPYGLRPTLRQLMLVVLGCTLFLGLLSMESRKGAIRDEGWLGAFWGSIMLAPGLIALPLCFLDRPGPVREWSVKCWLSLVLVTLTLISLGQLAGFGWTDQGTFRLVLHALILVCGCIGTVIVYRSLRPARCSSCGRLAVIPLIDSPVKPQDPRAQSGWCAACGQDYRRKGLAPWEPVGGDGASVEQGRSHPAGELPDGTPL